MTDLHQSLTEISKTDDPVEQGRQMVALFDALRAGPWRETTARRASPTEAAADLPDLSAAAEEDIRRQLDTIVIRATEEAEQLFPPKHWRNGAPRGLQQQV